MKMKCLTFIKIDGEIYVLKYGNSIDLGGPVEIEEQKQTALDKLTETEKKILRLK